MVVTALNVPKVIYFGLVRIEKIVDSYLASTFPYSAALTKQVATVFLLALQCTYKDLRNSPTTKDVIDLFKFSCGEVKHGDPVADNTAPQSYIPYNLFPDHSVVGNDYHLL
jgi:hypothetical protein